MVKISYVVCLFVVFLILTTSAKAQNSTASSQTIEAGIINGKAVSLVQPPYPRQAKEANVFGTVVIKVLIDEQGYVVSATPVKGNPLLQEVSVSAAKLSKFTPTFLAGHPVKVTGTIIYNFIQEEFDWFRVGSRLETIEFAPAIKSFSWKIMGDSLPKDWVFEKSQFQRLEELRQTEIANDKKTDKRDAPIALNFLPEQSTIALTLISSIQDRLTNRKTELWYFNSGIYLNKPISKPKENISLEESFNLAKQEYIEPLRQHLQNAPADIPSEIKTAFQRFIDVVDNSTISRESSLLVIEEHRRLSQTFTGTETKNKTE